jgi:hypothetical protein
MLGAALVILIAVPLMSLSSDDSQNDTTAAETARETPLDSETTAAITPALPTGSVRSALPGLPPTSSAAPAPGAGGEGSDPIPQVDAHNAATGGEGAANAPQGGTSDGDTVGGSGNGQGGGSATTTRAPAPAGQSAGAQPGGASSASSQSSTAQKPAPTSSTPAEPTKTCILDVLSVQVCI